MGHVFSIEDCERLARWYETPRGASVLAVERQCLGRVWAPPAPQDVLEVGCGTGAFLSWFASLGHRVTGLDPSPAAVLMASRATPAHVEVRRGSAEDLPFSDNEFDTVALLTSLEFVDHPALALAEAARVARRHVLLGVLNRWSPGALARRIEALFRETVLRRARFFHVFELQSLAEGVLFSRPKTVWRTCLFLPRALLPRLAAVERLGFLQRHPFGDFIAMRIDVGPSLLALSDPLPHTVAARPRPCGAERSGNLRTAAPKEARP